MSALALIDCVIRRQQVPTVYPYYYTRMNFDSEKLFFKIIHPIYEIINTVFYNYNNFGEFIFKKLL